MVSLTLTTAARDKSFEAVTADPDALLGSAYRPAVSPSVPAAMLASATFAGMTAEDAAGLVEATNAIVGSFDSFDATDRSNGVVGVSFNQAPEAIVESKLDAGGLSGEVTESDLAQVYPSSRSEAEELCEHIERIDPVVSYLPTKRGVVFTSFVGEDAVGSTAMAALDEQGGAGDHPPGVTAAAELETYDLFLPAEMGALDDPFDYDANETLRSSDVGELGIENYYEFIARQTFLQAANNGVVRPFIYGPTMIGLIAHSLVTDQVPAELAADGNDDSAPTATAVSASEFLPDDNVFTTLPAGFSVTTADDVVHDHSR